MPGSEWAFNKCLGRYVWQGVQRILLEWEETGTRGPAKRLSFRMSQWRSALLNFDDISRGYYWNFRSQWALKGRSKEDKALGKPSFDWNWGHLQKFLRFLLIHTPFWAERSAGRRRWRGENHQHLNHVVRGLSRRFREGWRGGVGSKWIWEVTKAFLWTRPTQNGKLCWSLENNKPW